MYYVYVLRCEDKSLYTGSARDIKKRIREHFLKLPQCAKYTRSHPPKKIEAVWRTETKSDAARVEYFIKALTKKEKEALLEKNDVPIKTLEKLEGILLKKLTQEELKEIMSFLNS